MNENVDKTMGVMFIVSTSHMDWHWHSTFEEYYNMGNLSDGHPPVRFILQEAISLLPNSASASSSQDGDEGAVQTANYQASGDGSGEALDAPPPYMYNLAEASWLKRYLQDSPSAAATLAANEGFFFFIGGGMTSPDNLVCNGEVFIRNFLVGRDFIKQAGLGSLVNDVCWVPDDFGNDPQLPVVLQAMGMSGVGFGRVPGHQPSGGNYTPQEGNSLSYQLALDGVTFIWKAADDSSVMAQYMLDAHQNPGYGVIWDQGTISASSGADTLNEFVSENTFYTTPPNEPVSPSAPPDPPNSIGVNQPGSILMAPCGGDFSTPSEVLSDAVQTYNESYAASNGVIAKMGSFEEFVDYMNEQVGTGAVNLPTRQGWDAMEGGFDASNYWTGHFANMVELKILQQRTSTRLQSAETLSTLLRGQSYISSATLDGLDQMIQTSWENLVPSSHHDYVNGTSPTWIYYLEQLPLLELALKQAEDSLSYGMQLLGESVVEDKATSDIPWVVFNPTGVERSGGNIVEIPFAKELIKVKSYYLEGDRNTLYPIQRVDDGGLLIQVSDMASTGYTSVYFSQSDPNTVPGSPLQTPEDDANFYLSNGAVNIGVSKATDDAYALSNIWNLSNGTQDLVSNGLCNQIQVYSESYEGNPYQMGTEFGANGFQLDTSLAYSSGKGGVTENGPYRWRFQGEISHTARSGEENKLALTYELHLNEPLVRVRVTGKAPEGSATSVVTSWNIEGAPSSIPAMSYGTANHWNGPNFTPYWTGPTFRSTHDYVVLTNPATPSLLPLGAIYHEGMRAWAFSEGELMGILLRNTNDNTGRGAQNSDIDSHTQNFAFRVPGVGRPETCQPLQESLAFQQPILTAPIKGNNSFNAVMESSGYLASVSGPALIRLARTQSGSGENSVITTPSNVPMPFSFVLRIYQPTNLKNGGTPEDPQNWIVDVPFLANPIMENSSSFAPVLSLVTALEDPISDLPTSTINPGEITLDQMDTLTTIRIQTWRPNIESATT